MLFFAQSLMLVQEKFVLVRVLFIAAPTIPKRQKQNHMVLLLAFWFLIEKV
jgi:hypothetical protein